jgi:hypothetical protein
MVTHDHELRAAPTSSSCKRFRRISALACAVRQMASRACAFSHRLEPGVGDAGGGSVLATGPRHPSALSVDAPLLPLIVSGHSVRCRDSPATARALIAKSMGELGSALGVIWRAPTMPTNENPRAKVPLDDECPRGVCRIRPALLAGTGSGSGSRAVGAATSCGEALGAQVTPGGGFSPCVRQYSSSSISAASCLSF